MHDEEEPFPVSPPPFEGAESGVKGLGGESRAKMLSPTQLFYKLFPETLFNMMVVETNKYAREQEADDERKRAWVDVSKGEMVLFHGLALAMSLHPVPSLEMYFRGDRKGAFAYPGLNQFMTLKRFEQIKRYFHIADSEARSHFPKDSSEYRLFHVQPVIDVLRGTGDEEGTFKKYYNIGEKVTVDERTIPIRNRQCPIRIYNKSKPYKFGIEVFTLCDSVTYYNWDFIVYDKVKCPGLHTKMVMDLCDSLPGEHHRVYLDRGFTSPLLLSQLKDELGHVATGTCVPTRKHYPAGELMFRRKEGERGDVKAVVEANKGMVALAWYDKRPVNFLSTAHGLEVAAVNRRIGSEVREVDSPEVAREYNLHKDAVDQFDKLCLKQNYSVEQEVIARRWWVKWYWGMVDAVLANCWILYDIIHQGERKRLNHMEFLISVQKGLVENPWLKQGRQRLITVSSSRVFTRLQPGPHWPVHSESSRGYCLVCMAKGQGQATGVAGRVRTSRSRFYCRSCSGSGEKTRVWLCIEGKNCFAEFHEKDCIPNLKIPKGSHLMNV